MKLCRAWWWHVRAWRSQRVLDSAPAACGACRGHTRDARRARPARERRERGRGSTRRSEVEPTRRPDWRPCSCAGNQSPSSSVDARGCEGRDRKSARNSSTCAVLGCAIVPSCHRAIVPSPLLEPVEQSSARGHARAQGRSLKKTEINPEEDASGTSIGRRRRTKNMHVHTGRRRADSDRR